VREQLVHKVSKERVGTEFDGMVNGAPPFDEDGDGRGVSDELEETMLSIISTLSHQAPTPLAP
jgi:hypothetical protein